MVKWGLQIFAENPSVVFSERYEKKQRTKLYNLLFFKSFGNVISNTTENLFFKEICELKW